MKNFLAIFLTTISVYLYAQGEFDNWHLGRGVSVNFSNNTPAVSFNSQVFTEEGTATVSDCEGNLLFYTNGVTVWNRNNTVMQNGSGLAGNPGNTSPALIVRRPGSNSIYFIFTSNNSSSSGFRYSVINMNANGGFGAVIQKNSELRLQSTGKIAVTYHANGEDVWVLTHYSGSRSYEAFLVTSTGVQTPGVISNGVFSHNSDHGDMTISQDGSKVAAAIDVIAGLSSDRVTLADFNNSNGRVTNEAVIEQGGNPHGCEFSPNGNNLFVNNDNGGVYKYNLQSGSNAQALGSRVGIGSGLPYGSLRLAPNGLIFVADKSGTNYSESLGVILNPNSQFPTFIKNGLAFSSPVIGYGIVNATLVSPPSFSGPNEIVYQPSCFGEEVEFRLQNTDDIVDVSWNFDDPSSGISNFSNSLSPTHKFSQAGSYNISVQITYLCGDETINELVVVDAEPDVDFQDTVIVCSGELKKIGSENNTNNFFEWTPATNLNSNTISNPIFSATSSSEQTFFNYNVKITSEFEGCEINTPVVVELVSPQVDAGPDKEVCLADTISIGTEQRAEYNYSWLPSEDLTDAQSGITNVIGSNENEGLDLDFYTLSAEYKGCTNTDNVIVFQKGNPSLNSPTAVEVCSNEELTLNPSPKTQHTYQWEDNGLLDDVNSASPTFSYDHLSNSDTIIYQYVNIEFRGCFGRDSIAVTVNPRSGIDDYQYLCPGLGAELSPFGSGTSFQWSPNDNITTDTSANPIVNPNSSRYYYLTVTDTFGCTYNDSVFVDINPNVPVELPNDTLICEGDTIDFGLNSYSNSISYEWSPTVGVLDPDSSRSKFFPSDTTLFFLTVTIDTCTGIDSFQINVVPKPNIELVQDTSICFGDSIILLAQGAQNYNWLVEENGFFYGDSALVFPNDTTEYIIEGFDALGCSAKDTAEVVVWQLPEIIGLTDTSSCFGDSLRLNVMASNGDYRWEPMNQFSNPNELSTTLYSERDTIVNLTVLDENGCISRDTFDYIVHPLPIIDIAGDIRVCEGETAELIASGGVEYSWSPEQFFNDPNQREQFVSVFNQTTFQVNVVSGEGCNDSSQVTVSTDEKPIADFEYDFSVNCDGFLVSFNDSSQRADEWLWLFGDGASSTDKNPEYSFDFGDRYTTRLIVGNNQTCYDTASVSWNWDKLEDLIEIEAPNIITPNNDKINDCFEYEINYNFDECSRLEVFNRWGLKVFDSDEFDGCFNAINRYNNQVLSNGTYFYVLSINEYKRNGFIQLMTD